MQTPEPAGALENTARRLGEELSETEEACRAVDPAVAGAVDTDADRRELLMSGAYERYRHIVEGMEQGAVTISPSGEILFANGAFTRLLGDRLEHILQTPLESWVAAEDQERTQGLLADGPVPRDMEIALLPDIGGRAHVRATVVSASEDFSTIIFTDLSAQALHEEARATVDAIRSGGVDALVVDGSQVVLLESASSPYRELVDRMRHGVLTLSDEGRVSYFNARLQSMMHARRETLAGAHLADLVVEADRPKVRSMCASRVHAQGELRLRRGDGRSCAVHAAMIVHGGQRMFLFTDLTEQKRHLASDELTRKFLGLLAEEFQDMLRTIEASADVLRSEASSPQGRVALEGIRKTTRMMGALVEDLRRINPRE
jgi:PAS domain S-box-containing protein